MTPRYSRQKNQHILYDDALLGHADAALFDPAHWAAQGGVRGQARGRGAALFVAHQGRDYVLRHYRRGGLFAPLLGDRYLWSGLERTRAWREWRLLHAMHAQGLPVPQPVAARVVRSGPAYRADLLMLALPGTRSLAGALAHGPVTLEGWHQVGQCIRRFHAAGIFHADLNAHNILLADDGQVFLIDFDRGARRAAGSWQAANVARLRRSLDKLHNTLPVFHFDEAAWRALREGYARA